MIIERECFVVAGKQAPCQIKVYIVSLDCNDSTKGVGWLTGYMRAWWETEGGRRFSQVCFNESLTTADYRLD